MHARPAPARDPLLAAAIDNRVITPFPLGHGIDDGTDPLHFRSQLGQMNRLGSFEQILGMLPGGQKLKELTNDGLPEKEMKRVAAIIDSMTTRERRDHTVINGSRKKRIARGSGTSVQEVNRLIKQFLQARKIAKVMSGTGGRRQLAQMFRGM